MLGAFLMGTLAKSATLARDGGNRRSARLDDGVRVFTPLAERGMCWPARLSALRWVGGERVSDDARLVVEQAIAAGVFPRDARGRLECGLSSSSFGATATLFDLASLTK